MFDYVKIETEEQIKELCKLAHEIWNEYSICFIDQPQIDYMLEKFQSEEMVCRQIKGQNYSYYFLEDDGENFGYFAVQPQKSTGALFLSKLYINKKFRGKGYGRKAFEVIYNIAKELELGKIKLTVNKYNISSIFVYEKLGFVRVADEVTDIGGGYVMDDYIYEYNV